MIDSILTFIEQSLSPAGEILYNPTLISSYLGTSILRGLYIVLPFLLVTVFLALIGPTLMGGFTFSPSAMAFKVEKLDPIKGLSRIFSKKGLIELVKALLKFLLIASVALALFFLFQTEMMSLARLNVAQGIIRSGELIIWAALCAALSLSIIAGIDIPFQIWEHSRQLKMTKQEVRDESKETDGRPEVKARIRQLQREASQRRMMEAVPEADVIITNPTHYSVALKYDQNGSAAPVVVAKGADLIALKIRAIATEHAVPIYSSHLLLELFLVRPKLVKRYLHHFSLLLPGCSLTFFS